MKRKYSDFVSVEYNTEDLKQSLDRFGLYLQKMLLLALVDEKILTIEQYHNTIKQIRQEKCGDALQ